MSQTGSTLLASTSPLVKPPTRALLLSKFRRRSGDGGWVIPAFLVVWFVLVLVPLVVLVAFSFFETKSYVTIYKPSLNTWASLFQSGRFEVTLRTLRIALTVTVIELFVAFPFALW